MNPADIRTLLKVLAATFGMWIGKVTAEAVGLHDLLGSAVGGAVGWWVGHQLTGAMGLA